MDDELSRLYQIRNIYQQDDVFVKTNPILEGSIDSMTHLSSYDVENMKRLTSNFGSIRTNINSFTASVSASGTMVPSMAVNTLFIADHMEPRKHVYQYTEPLRKPSSLDRQKKLSAQLSKINPILSTELNGAWQTLRDRSKDDRFRQAASSAREVISHLLQILAPDDQVTTTEWFVPNPETKGNPTQRQRAKYAMFGRNDLLNEKELEPIFTLSDNIRNEYRKLNKITHLRKYEYDLQKRTEGLIDQCQIYILKLLEIRKSYFKL